MNQIVELLFSAGAAIVVLMTIRRRRRLDDKQRNAAATAAFGLMLCGRYAALVAGVADWIFVIAIAAMMAMLAYNNLGFAKVERASVR